MNSKYNEKDTQKKWWGRREARRLWCCKKKGEGNSIDLAVGALQCLHGDSLPVRGFSRPVLLKQSRVGRFRTLVRRWPRGQLRRLEKLQYL